MSASNLIRWSGLATMLGGIGMILFILAHPFGELDPPKVMNGLWVLANSLRVVGAIFVLFGLMGLYVLQAEKAGRRGLISFVLAFIGTALFVGNSSMPVGRCGYLLDVCDPNPLCISRFSGFVRRFYRCPVVGTDPLGYLAFALALLTQERYDVLLRCMSRRSSHASLQTCEMGEGLMKPAGYWGLRLFS